MLSELRYHAEIESFRVVSFDGVYYAVPKSRWPIRPSDLLDKFNRSILSASSLTEIVQEITTRTPPFLSIIIPTRGRPAMLRRALDSLKETAHNPEQFEVILVTDTDDATMEDFVYDELPLQRATVQPGMTMGGLNMAGYDLASGDHIFLLNDDIVARTPGWDTLIAEALKSFPDGIALIHVNDKLFGDSLCTFPLVSRTLCELMGGLCPREYIRYRIDDHIHNVFNLLGLLGRRRILYLEEVVFEHLNRLAGVEGTAGYLPDERIHARDSLFFDEQLPARKAVAVRLAAHIDAFFTQNLAGNRANKLIAVTDSVAIRDSRYTRRSQNSTRLSSDNTRVTVGVVSADIRSEHAQKCLDSLKRNTRNFDLIVLDNNRGPGFNHAVEMNRLFSVANTDYIALLDDDVFVEPGWLDGMLGAVTPSVGLVTPGHKNLLGDFVYGGIVLRPDQSGHHTHIFSQSAKPRRVQTVCSAAYLLDLTKCGHLRVDEQYTKYFLDVEFGLKVWEAGFEVVCASSTVVTHVGGGTLRQGSELSGVLYEEQRRKFITAWIETGRYWKLESVTWRQTPDLRPLVEHPGLVGRILSAALDERSETFDRRIENYCATFGAYPALLQFAENAAYEALTDLSGPDYARENLARFIASSQRRRTENPDVSSAQENVSGRAPFQPLIEDRSIDAVVSERFDDLSSFVFNGGTRNGHANGNGSQPRHKHAARWQQIIEAPALVKEYLDRWIVRKGELIGALPPSVDDVTVAPEYVGGSVEGVERWIRAITPDRAGRRHRGFIISRFEHKYFGIGEDEGEFSYERFRSGGYHRVVVGHSMTEALGEIDRIVDNGKAARLRSLVFLPSEACQSLKVIEAAVGPSATYLVGSHENGGPRELNGRNTMKADAPSVTEWASNIVRSGQTLDSKLGPDRFDEVVLPWTYSESMRSNLLESAASKIANRIRVVHGSGKTRSYDGENLHRIAYNKAYLASMMERVPTVEGLNVLEVGCSDGLVCDIIALMGAKSVVGIDVMQSAGCSFPGDKIEYRMEDAAKTSFKDEQFDLCLSIATLEHVPDPQAVLQEMLRVTKVGGFCYVQAGPLYHSPFGHHMFAYFADYPWIHVRKTREEILTYIKERGIDRAIERDLASSPEEYLSGMLNHDHINGLLLEQYGLEGFRRRRDVDVLKFNISYEGRDLLTPQVLSETRHLKPESLVEHGFEILFRRIGD